jgi:hypothetical protein
MIETRSAATALNRYNNLIVSLARSASCSRSRSVLMRRVHVVASLRLISRQFGFRWNFFLRMCRSGATFYGQSRYYPKG